MKCFRKLLKGLAGNAAFIAVLLLLALGLGCYLAADSMERLIVTTLLYMVFLVMILLGVGVYAFVVATAYERAQRKLRSIPGFSQERFERETARSPQIRRVLLSSDAICYADGGYLVKVIPLTDILWVYQEEGQGRANDLRIFTRDRQKHHISIVAEGKGKERAARSEPALRYVLRLIARKNPNAIIGYSAETEKLYRKDFARLLAGAGGKEIPDSAQLEEEYLQNDYYRQDFQ